MKKKEKSLCETCSNRVVANYHNNEKQYHKSYCYFEIVKNEWDPKTCSMILDSIVDDCSFYNKNFILIKKNEHNEDDVVGDSNSEISNRKDNKHRHQAICGNME